MSFRPVPISPRPERKICKNPLCKTVVKEKDEDYCKMFGNAITSIKELME